MAPSFTRPCVVACAITAASGLHLSILKVDEDTSYPMLGAGSCTQDERDNGSRIGDWIYGQKKRDAQQVCAVDPACKGFHWNKEDKSYVLVSSIGPLGDDTEKGEVCYQKPEAAVDVVENPEVNGESDMVPDGDDSESEDLSRVNTDEKVEQKAELTDAQQAIAQEHGAALDAAILEMTTGKPDWRMAASIKDLVAAHPKLPSVAIGSKSCIGNDGAHACAELKGLKSLTVGDDNGITAKLLSTLTKLTSLTLGSTNGFDAGVYMALGGLTDLTSLTIGSKNQFGLDGVCGSAKPKANATEDASEEVELFAKPRDLIKEEHKAFAMAKALKHVGNILVGESNCIGVEGAKALGQLKRLRSLNIGSKNSIGVDGAVALGALTKLTNITIGNGNAFGTKGFKALSELTKLTSLTIGDKNSFGVDHHQDKEEKREKFQAQCQKAHQDDEE